MRLFLFPEIPNQKDGYAIAVKCDLDSIQLVENDYLVFFTDHPELFPEVYAEKITNLGAHLRVIKRNRSIFKVLNEIFSFRHPSHCYGVVYREAMNLPELIWDEIFCGDVIFYLEVQRSFRFNSLTVRFHNVWSKLVSRASLNSVQTSLKFRILNLWLGTRLERKIVRDKNCTMSFLSKSDHDFIALMTGNNRLKMIPVIQTLNPVPPGQSFDIFYEGKLRLIWFGSVVAHNVYGLKWFLKKVYEPLVREGLSLEFHLFGRNTESFGCDAKHVYGYGRLEGPDLPFEGNGLFINPDLLGGGVKMKMQFMLENRLQVLTTPFGMDGYDDLHEFANLNIVESNDWKEYLKEIIQSSKK